MAYVRLIPLTSCPPGEGTFVTCGGKELAVFRLPGETVVVLDNTCPHAGGNLAAGEVRDGHVICPVHEWAFDANTGVCPDSPKVGVNVYSAEIREGAIWADLDAPKRRPLHG